MSKHTPGPWIAIATRTRWDPGAHKPIFDDGMWAILPEYKLERIPIAMVDHADDHHPPTRERAELDARLIAAAPELLEACRQVSIALNARGLETSVCGVVDRAIAKAEQGTADAQREPLQNTPEATQQGEALGNGQTK